MYVRAVRRSDWTRLGRSGPDAIAEAVADLLRRGETVSVYECVSCADAELVAVALSANRTAQPFHYIAISPEELAAEAVVPVRSPGETPLAAANALHRDLDLSEGRAERVVARLAARGAMVGVVRERQLRASARKLCAAGQLVPEDCWLLR